MVRSGWSADHPACDACVQDEIYDRTGRHPRAAVRVVISREPYVLRLCEQHVAQLAKVLPAAGMKIVERLTLSHIIGDEESADVSRVD